MYERKPDVILLFREAYEVRCLPGRVVVEDDLEATRDVVRCHPGLNRIGSLFLPSPDRLPRDVDACPVPGLEPLRRQGWRLGVSRTDQKVSVKLGQVDEFHERRILGEIRSQ